MTEVNRLQSTPLFNKCCPLTARGRLGLGHGVRSRLRWAAPVRHKEKGRLPSPSAARDRLPGRARPQCHPVLGPAGPEYMQEVRGVRAPALDASESRSPSLNHGGSRSWKSRQLLSQSLASLAGQHSLTWDLASPLQPQRTARASTAISVRGPDRAAAGAQSPPPIASPPVEVPRGWGVRRSGLRGTTGPQSAVSLGG
ncbi:hypothetical protein NDU88_001227 [Pleurodeles waltl]|uniref:Uncharacterized protein n=1 Tax=Pleurodeles waltl TaxID=8319 RepID=A0AAV7US76_PLEWA|nr:hypothetical protein NDU88_001227 [Pleurodeles waltl]